MRSPAAAGLCVMLARGAMSAPVAALWRGRGRRRRQRRPTAPAVAGAGAADSGRAPAARRRGWRARESREAIAAGASCSRILLAQPVQQAARRRREVGDVARSWLEGQLEQGPRPATARCRRSRSRDSAGRRLRTLGPRARSAGERRRRRRRPERLLAFDERRYGPGLRAEQGRHDDQPAGRRGDRAEGTGDGRSGVSVMSISAGRPLLRSSSDRPALRACRRRPARRRPPSPSCR